MKLVILVRPKFSVCMQYVSLTDKSISLIYFDIIGKAERLAPH